MGPRDEGTIPPSVEEGVVGLEERSRLLPSRPAIAEDEVRPLEREEHETLPRMNGASRLGRAPQDLERVEVEDDDRPGPARPAPAEEEPIGRREPLVGALEPAPPRDRDRAHGRLVRRLGPRAPPLDLAEPGPRVREARSLQPDELEVARAELARLLERAGVSPAQHRIVGGPTRAALELTEAVVAHDPTVPGDPFAGLAGISLLAGRVLSGVG